MANILQDTYLNRTSDAEPVRDPYRVTQHSFPEGLGVRSDLLHYIQFQINMRGKSKFLPASVRAEVTENNRGAAQLTTEQLGRTVTGSAALAGGAIGTGIASKLQSVITKAGGQSSYARELGAKVVGAVAGAATAATIASLRNATSILKDDKTYRISDVISLHIENPPMVRYGMNYANKELGTLAGIIGATAGASDSIGSLTGEMGQALLTSLAKVPGAFGVADVQSALSVASKTSLNPFKETVFESVDFRTFAFKHKFMPRNETELRSVKNIIDLFKFHMHPDISSNKLFFIYPSEFVISYLYNNGENEFFHKFAPCVLESMDVTYGGEQHAAFRNGAPVEVNTTLVFRELEILTKEKIREGY